MKKQPDTLEIKDGIKTFHARSRKDWRKWLEKNHATEKSVWLILYRMESIVPSVYYPEAVEEALCFGWIDSKPNKRDSESRYQYFSKRKPKSNWSKINKERVARLMEQGLISEAGMKMIELAKQSGTWNALDAVEDLVIPDDLQELFTHNKKALKNWEQFPRSAKKGILEWILNAKRTETRQKRIEETVKLAAENIRANQYGQ